MQRAVAGFVQENGLLLDAQARYIDVVSEVGELGKALLMGGGYEGQPIAATPEIQGELGDCLFSLLALAEVLGISAEEALQGALAKYARRIAQTGSASSDGER